MIVAHETITQTGQASGTRPSPPLDEPLVARPGMMIGRVMTWDGRPVPRFTIEYAAYAVENQAMRLDVDTAPNVVAKVDGRDGYYEIRLPEGSYGLVSGVTLPLIDGHQTFRFWAETPGTTRLDFLEVRKGNPGVIKNFVWNLRSGGAASFVASANFGGSLTIVEATELVKNVATLTLAARNPAGARVSMTLTPRSPLIDGTEGRVLTRVIPIQAIAGRAATLRDIPFAVYEIAARIELPDGTSRDLHVAIGAPGISADGMNRTYQWQQSATIDFVAIGTAASEAERNAARLVIGESR
jgi:hypothetical protein